MSAAYFLKTPALFDALPAKAREVLVARAARSPMDQYELWAGVVIRDVAEAMRLFLEATQDEEWAELRWSS